MLPESESSIMYPHTEVVSVPSDVDFVYIMRKDGAYAMAPIAQRLAAAYGKDVQDVQLVLESAYDTFFASLADQLTWAFSQKGTAQLHVYDAKELDAQVRTKTNGLPIVSLDPVMTRDVYSIGISRQYYSGGTKDLGQTNRPGFASLSLQTEQLKHMIGYRPVVVVEDDIFSGGSVIGSLEALLGAGISIAKIVPGIQIGRPKKLEAMGIAVDPVISYQTADGTDIFNKIDLGDPRDFLLGASGLVIKLPDGSHGRAPYLLPFVSTAARASIPKALDQLFAQKVLLANLAFFEEVEAALGVPVTLEHMEPSTATFLHTVFGIDHHAGMATVTTWCLENLDELWKISETVGVYQQVKELELPQKLVFLDVDGTIIPDDSPDGRIDSYHLQEFILLLDELEEQGIVVGLNSDSPLPQLQAFAKKLGMADCPIIAENGNMLAYNGKTVVLNALPQIQAIRQALETHIASMGYAKQDDFINPTFGGNPIDFDSGQWAFGAHRVTSISVFGPPELIHSLGQIAASYSGISYDCSPEYNYFAVHPGTYKENKGKTLAFLVTLGHEVMMIGNTMSDWVDPASGVECAFVANASLPPALASGGKIASASHLAGVIGLLMAKIGGAP